jgi:uncharacterized protein DUF3592
MALARALLSLLAVGLVALAIHLHVVVSTAREWSSTTGVIVASYVRKTGAGNAGEAGDTDTYSPVVNYEYRVGSDPYAGSKIGFGDFFYNWYSSKSRVRAFPKGSNVTVYFDPQDPSSAVLDRTYPSVAIAMLTGIAFLCLIGAVFLPKLAQIAMDALIPQRRKNA